MARNRPKFPRLFKQIGNFLYKFDDLRNDRKKLANRKLSTDDFIKRFDKLVKGKSPSSADEALDAFKEIVEIMYVVSARGSCTGGSTRIKA